jgi:hypothetical protein
MKESLLGFEIEFVEKLNYYEQLMRKARAL